MTKREKILLGITVTATGASICMFAFVSLAHFLKATPNVHLPMATKLYENTVTQLSTLDIAASPVPTPTNTVSQDVNVASYVQATNENEQKNKKSGSLSRDKISSRDETIREIVRKKDMSENPEKVVTQVLTELGLDQNTINALQLKRLL